MAVGWQQPQLGWVAPGGGGAGATALPLKLLRPVASLHLCLLHPIRTQHFYSSPSLQGDGARGPPCAIRRRCGACDRALIGPAARCSSQTRYAHLLACMHIYSRPITCGHCRLAGHGPAEPVSRRQKAKLSAKGSLGSALDMRSHRLCVSSPAAPAPGVRYSQLSQLTERDWADVISYVKKTLLLMAIPTHDSCGKLCV